MHRVYNDFFMPSRITALEEVLLYAKSASYEIVSIETYLRQRMDGSDARKTLLLRHDIDTDPATARLIWDMECRYGIRGSFFFRTSTADIKLMRAIDESGAEVGYHFEEISSVIKSGMKFKSKSDLLRSAASLFCSNLNSLRDKAKLPLHGVASHGDFVNRRVGIINNELLNNEIRRDMKISYEAYDDSVVTGIDLRIADRMFPAMWYPESPREAIDRGLRVIQLLIHPRQWRSAPLVNAKDNFFRVIEGTRYKISGNVIDIT